MKEILHLDKESISQNQPITTQKQYTKFLVSLKNSRIQNIKIKENLHLNQCHVQDDLINTYFIDISINNK